MSKYLKKEWTWSDLFWESEVDLPAWVEFHYQNEESSSSVVIRLESENNGTTPASAEQLNAIIYLVENQEVIKEHILNELRLKYNEWIPIYGYDEEDAELYMPTVTETSEFRKLISLGSIYVLDSDKEGFAYVGYDFACSWDDEHGLGVMTYKDEILEIGQADSASNSWVTYEHNGTYEQKQQEWNEQHPNFFTKKNEEKPWWKFW